MFNCFSSPKALFDENLQHIPGYPQKPYKDPKLPIVHLMRRFFAPLTNAKFPVALVQYERVGWQTGEHSELWALSVFLDTDSRYGPSFYVFDNIQLDLSKDWILIYTPWDKWIDTVKHQGAVYIGDVPYRSLKDWKKLIVDHKIEPKDRKWDSFDWTIEILNKMRETHPQWLSRRLLAKNRPLAKSDFQRDLSRAWLASTRTIGWGFRPHILYLDRPDTRMVLNMLHERQTHGGDSIDLQRDFGL